MRNVVTRVLPVAAGLLMMAGCATHPETLSRVKADLASPDFNVDTNSRPYRVKDVSGSDKILYLSERARAYQLAGDHERSTADYLAAESAYDALDERPVASITGMAGTGAAATVANDKILPYAGNAHERLMLYQLDAFNQLVRGDWNNTRAAVNNIVYLAEKSRERREKEIDEVRKAEADDSRLAYRDISNNCEFREKFAATDALARKCTDSLQNGYAYYFSAFVREMDGDTSTALIGYKRAYEVAPWNTFVRNDIARLTAHGSNPTGATSAQPNVVVFFEEGFAPQLDQFTFSYYSLPVSRHHSVGIAQIGSGNSTALPVRTSKPISVLFTLPYYPASELNVPSIPLEIIDNAVGGVSARTQLIGDFRALAARAFKDRLPYIATRAVFRAILKATAAAALNETAKNDDSGAKLGAMIGGLLITHGTESADLRTWLLAPRYGQIAKFRAMPGERDFAFQHGANATSCRICIPESGMLVLHVISIPGRIIVEEVALEMP